MHDFGEDHGTSYFSMEFVDGENLSALVKKKKSWPRRSICRTASSGVIGLMVNRFVFTMRVRRS